MDKHVMNKDEVTKRILQTSRETERLKEELQNLIAAGLKGNSNVNLGASFNETSLQSSNKVQIIKSYDSKHSHPPKLPENKTSDFADKPKEGGTSPKQGKPYNVDQAREYIKKQKEKRLAEGKLKKTHSKTTTELRKEKLQELQQKASELVKKNVEAKRQRSRSREPPIVRTRSQSREPKPVLRHHLTKQPEKKSPRDSIIQYNCAPRSKKHDSSQPLPLTTENVKLSTARSLEHLPVSARTNIASKNPNLLYPPSVDYARRSLEEAAAVLHSPKLEELKISNKDGKCVGNKISSDKSNKESRSRRDMFLKDCERKKSESSTESSKSTKPRHSSDQQKKEILIQSNVTLRQATDNACEIQKETQYPDWLKYSNPHTDPYNFINTVRRQLKYAVSEQPPPIIDVAPDEKIPSFLADKSDKSSKKADLKSFISHRCLNLDPHAIDHIEIGSKQKASKEERRGAVKSTSSHSESDTSKNIPSISSESRTSVKYTEAKESSYASSVKISKDTQSEKESEKIIELIKGKSQLLESSSTHISTEMSAKAKSLPDKKKPVKSSRERQTSNSEEIASYKKSDINSGDNSDSNKENIDRFSLVEPKSSLKSNRTADKVKAHLQKSASLKNISVRTEKPNNMSSNTNQIHLKFEAEIHLLNDFNKSLQHLTEIEKEFEALRSQNDGDFVTKKIFLHRDTQTSVINTSVCSSSTKNSLPTTHISTINYSRGSFANDEQKHDTSRDSVTNMLDLNSTSDWKGFLSNTTTIDHTSEKTSSMVQYSSHTFSKNKNPDCYNEDNLMFKNVAGVSLKMFDQLIKDEDVRIENLKKILKIREQALLDKTRSELVWLEIQKKQFIETKRFEEASLIKRKQRGILLRHQQERQEMQKLKQMQKEASTKRKTVLRRQQNGIKNQLLSGNMLSVLKTTGSRDRSERRVSGPLKVIQTNSVSSDTSLSMPATGTDQEMKSVTSLANIVSTHSDSKRLDLEQTELIFNRRKSISDSALTNMKQKLLMREKALAKRRRTVEELLQWHHKLLQEERVIEDLESKVKTMVSKIPSEREDDKTTVDASGSSRVEEVPTEHIPLVQQDDVAPEVSGKVVYSADFEAESSISSISQLIEDFNKIEDKILNFSLANAGVEQDNVSEDAATPVTRLEIQHQPSAIVPVEEHTEILSDVSITEPPQTKSPDLVVIETGGSPKSFNLEHDPVGTIAESLASSEVNEIVPEDSINISKDISEEISRPESSPVSETPEDTTAKPSIEVSPKQSTPEEKSVSEEVQITHDMTELDEINHISPISSDHEASQEKNDISTSKSVESIVEETKESSASTSQSAPSQIVLEEDTSAVPDDNFTPSDPRQFSENKTDEEKAASLTSKQSRDSESCQSTNAESMVVERTTSEEKPSTSSEVPEEIISDVDSTTEESPIQPTTPVDVKKRVQEILSDASSVSRSDKSPRMQDLCVMTYDLISPTPSPDSGSPLDEKKSFSLGSEAEELLKKQLAIEQEIKLLTEQQQKEQMPLVYIREIPNKPPPPYTPPSKGKPPKVISVNPTKDEIEQITEYSAKIIHKAYSSNNLDNISISDKTLSLIAKNVDKSCFKYVFDLCKGIAIKHYGQFVTTPGPSWLQQEKPLFPLHQKPLDANGLQHLMNRKLLELLGYQKEKSKRENTIMKWSRKKRDHVDEVLIQEMQNEEASWTNFEADELLVKDRITKELMDILVKETADVLQKTVWKKTQTQ